MSLRTVLLSMTCVALCAAVTAGEEPDPTQKARDAFAAVAPLKQKMDQAVADYRKVPKTDKAAQADARQVYNDARKMWQEANTAFRDAFAKADWNGFDVKGEAEMLEAGLYQVASGGDSTELSIKAAEALLAKLPDCKSSQGPARYVLQSKLAHTGDLDTAVKRSRALIEGAADENYKMRMWVLLGDMQAAVGATDAAQESYAAVLDAVPEGSTDRNQARQRRYASARAALVGKPAPAIDSEDWMGADATPFAGLQGKVVLLDFWATWCPPCRAVMPGLDDFAAEKKGQGLEVLGVTRFYKSGFLPKGPDTPHEGERVKDITPETYSAHLAAFREAMEIDYPFVVGTEDHFKAYGVTGIPTLVVVDRAGKVAYVTVGSGNEKLLHAAVNRLLLESGGGEDVKGPNAE